MSGPPEDFRRPAGSAVLMHVAILSSDIERSLRFYRDGLGFRRTYEWTTSASPTGETLYRGHGALIELGGSTYLELLLGNPAEPDQGSSVVHHIAIVVPDVDEAYRRCVEAGGKPVEFDGTAAEPVTAVVNGDPALHVRDAFVQGPSGEVIELYQQLSEIMTIERDLRVQRTREEDPCATSCSARPGSGSRNWPSAR